MKGSQNTDKKQFKLVDVYQKQAFDDGFKNYFSKNKVNYITEVLNDTERNIRFNTVTYRQLNSWGAQGLLTIDREGSGWRKFSVMDAVWIKIIQILRDFGLSLDKIKTAKESLSHLSDLYNSKMPFLEFYTAFAIGSKMPVIILVFKDGVAIPANLTQFKVANEYLGVENHLQINLNNILQELFPELDLKAKFVKEMPVSVQEAELLAFIRIAEYEKIEVRYSNGEMRIIEGMERIKGPKLIGEILKEQRFAEIKVVQQDGKVTEVLRTTKKKII